jgi:FKBP12-rapamycin complex-associated protein
MLIVGSGHQLDDLVRSCALPYLEDELPEIRLRAVITCCRLFMRDISGIARSNTSLEIINDVLEKLLTVSISDTGAYTRSFIYTLINREQQTQTYDQLSFPILKKDSTSTFRNLNIFACYLWS